MEQTVQAVRQLTCTIVSALEAKCGAQPDQELFPVNHPVFCWSVLHSAWIRNRYAVMQSLTAFERRRGSIYKGKVCEYGERVLGYLSQPGRGKAAARWSPAIWLGKTAHNDCHILASPAGIFVSRSVRRFGRAYDPEMLSNHVPVGARLGQPRTQACAAEPSAGPAPTSGFGRHCTTS